MKSQKFTDLIVWQKAHQLVLEIYKVTKNFPREEIYGLTSQMRRSAISIPANIAEGFVKKGIKDKIRFFNIAQGSLEELKYYLLLSKDLKYYEKNEINLLSDKVGKLLNGYINGILTTNS